MEPTTKRRVAVYFMLEVDVSAARDVLSVFIYKSEKQNLTWNYFPKILDDEIEAPYAMCW